VFSGTGTGSSPGRAHQATGSSTTSPERSGLRAFADQVTASPINAGPFGGSWHVHTEQLDIQSDGSGAAEWPIHAWCGTGSPLVTQPCDQSVSRGNYEEIIPGGRAELQLMAVSGNAAEALISQSTDPSQLPNGRVGLSIASDDVLTVTTASGRLVLCGPRAAALTIPQQNAEGINCGA
jgi:hypothetical protein